MSKTILFACILTLAACARTADRVKTGTGDNVADKALDVQRDFLRKIKVK